MPMAGEPSASIFPPASLVFDRPDRALQLLDDSHSFLPATVGIRHRNRGHEFLGVVVLRVAEDCRARADFDDLAKIHDRHTKQTKGHVNR